MPIASRSEHRRQVNPKKLYVADHALAAAFRVGREDDVGHAFENLVACELQNRGCTLAYVRTEDGHEVDFLATARDGQGMLVQVAAEVQDGRTLERELRAFAEARREYRDARAVLLLANELPRGVVVPKGIEVETVWRWALLG